VARGTGAIVTAENGTIMGGLNGRSESTGGGVPTPVVLVASMMSSVNQDWSATDGMSSRSILDWAQDLAAAVATASLRRKAAVVGAGASKARLAVNGQAVLVLMRRPAGIHDALAFPLSPQQ
jgi:hypothetical protein